MEVKPWNDKRESEMYDCFADLYGIIKATEESEKAYVRDINVVAWYVPATVKHRPAACASTTTSAAIVAECVQIFITLMDFLKLNMIAVDQVDRLLYDPYSYLKGRSILPPEFEAGVKMEEWAEELSTIGAADELTEQEAMQPYFHLDSSYNSFMAAALRSAGT